MKKSIKLTLNIEFESADESIGLSDIVDNHIAIKLDGDDVVEITDQEVDTYYEY